MLYLFQIDFIFLRVVSGIRSKLGNCTCDKFPRENAITGAISYFPTDSTSSSQIVFPLSGEINFRQVHQSIVCTNGACGLLGNHSTGVLAA